jgi:lysophospholipase L1-like esterase
MVGRGIIILFGVGIIALAIALGQRATLGLEANSVGQFTLIGIGVLFLVIGAAGKRLSMRRLSKGYGQLAVILLNTLLFLIVLELLILLSFNTQFVTRNQQLVTGDEDLEVFRGAEWMPKFQEENRELWSPRYSYFDLWTNNAYKGETVNISEEGVRLTPGSDCQPDSYRIFMFGGSTMWGVGVPDWGTIPAYMQSALTQAFNGRVCVVNYGDTGFVSTQEMIRLMKLLQRGDVPDMVIFYDGVNDVIAAYNAGEAGAHRNLSSFVNAITAAPPNPLVQWLLNTHIVRFAQGLISSGAPAANPPDYTALSGEVVDLYLNNVRMVNALAGEYGFTPVMLWQPVLVVESKPPTDEEYVMTQVVGGDLMTMYRESWAQVKARQGDVENLYYIADALDGIEAPLYFDHHHLALRGNEVVANRIIELIAPMIAAQ